jgi:hypothetical protein
MWISAFFPESPETCVSQASSSCHPRSSLEGKWVPSQKYSPPWLRVLLGGLAFSLRDRAVITVHYLGKRSKAIIKKVKTDKEIVSL